MRLGLKTVQNYFDSPKPPRRQRVIAGVKEGVLSPQGREDVRFPGKDSLLERGCEKREAKKSELTSTSVGKNHI